MNVFQVLHLWLVMTLSVVNIRVVASTVLMVVGILIKVFIKFCFCVITLQVLDEFDIKKM